MTLVSGEGKITSLSHMVSRQEALEPKAVPNAKI